MHGDSATHGKSAQLGKPPPFAHDMAENFRAAVGMPVGHPLLEGECLSVSSPTIKI
jgi:hypothetical protein